MKFAALVPFLGAAAASVWPQPANASYGNTTVWIDETTMFQVRMSSLVRTQKLIPKHPSPCFRACGRPKKKS